MYSNGLYVDKNGFLRTKENNIVIGEIAIDLNGKKCLIIKKPHADTFDAVPLTECVKTLVDNIEKKPKAFNQKNKINGSSSKELRENTK